MLHCFRSALQITALMLFSMSLRALAYQEVRKLDVNDVSWLWPAPAGADDVGLLISMEALTGADGAPVWSKQAFDSLIKAADGEKAQAKTPGGIQRKIALREEFRTQGTWKLAAFRIDPSAPGASAEMRAAFGTKPQIRLIVQPVTNSNNAVKVHDFTAHLVFDFAVGKDADREAFQKIADDLATLKGSFKEMGISTGGPLNVHPALKKVGEKPEIAAAVRAFLSRHLAASRLSAMAIMGLPAQSPEPWIFMPLARLPNGEFVPFPAPGLFGESAQMLSFLDNPHVVPDPRATNRNAIKNNLAMPVADRRGVSTSTLFVSGINLDEFAVIGVDGSGAKVMDPELRNRDIADFVANPQKTFFFNADCISCHTESRRRMKLNIAEGAFAFKPGADISGVSPDVLPKDDWNLRNFGWFQVETGDGPATPTATKRTANESAEAAETLNREYLARPRQSN